MSRAGSLLLLVLALALGVSLAFAAPPSAPPPPPAARALPPGATVDDPGPSPVVFPAQSMPLRFDHKKHMVGLQCTSCHTEAATSTQSADRLLPSPRKCDGCHETDHSSLAAVKAGPDAEGQCAFCHVGYSPDEPNRVAPVSIPTPNLVFDHRAHAARNIGCGQCHGAVEDLSVATRDQLPRMRGCFKCHQMPDSAARGAARSDCLTCHVKSAPGDARAGRMKVVFAQGALLPPRWLHNAAHTPDWIDRHKMVAANDSQFCGNCHKEDFCTDCHDGRVRPRNIHPGDYLNMHAIEARMASERCTSCHREQSFCLSCHQRVGVSMTGPGATKASGRFHPPKSVWSDAPRQRGHHAEEAQRNLNACVSCHVERDCVVCHGGAGIGGGFNPHRPGFAASCASAMRRNSRPCFVCHEPGAAALAACR
ncbi:MAG: cytochrome c3 family protein [Polyangiaceae bacterium]